MKLVESFLDKNRVIAGKFIFPFFLILMACSESQALTIVRMEMQLATTVADVDMQLYDEDTPLTVSNFLGYVNRGDYDSSFFHRSISSFIVQGGGYTYEPKIDFDARQLAVSGATRLAVTGDPLTGELGLKSIGETYLVDADGDDIEDLDSTTGLPLTRVNDSLQEVPVDSTTLPVLNEPGISNLRGTLAMAKFAGDPNSATKEWYVNIADNSANLDAQNGGFAVFGHIIGSGMDYFDDVNILTSHPSTYQINSAFSDLPIVNADGSAYTSDGLILDENLAKINSASEILHIDMSNADFGGVAVGLEEQRSIVITNKWSNAITIGKFEDQDTLSAPYSVISDNCSGAVIQPAATCDVVLGLNLPALGIFHDTADFSFVTPNISNVKIELSGFSAASGPAINVEQLVDFGDVVQDSNVLSQSLIVTNNGNELLTISSITEPLGVNASNFSMIHDCVSLSLGATCTVTLDFIPNSIISGLGDKMAAITINSNDSVVVVDLIGSVSTEIDGVSDTEENAGPNSGDGNNNNVLDSVEANVASLQTVDGDYVTIAINNDINLHNVNKITNPSPSDTPNVSFSKGFISFDVIALSIFTSNLYGFDVAIILPEGSNMNTYYQYGSTDDNIAPHWYEFMYDETTGTGARIQSNSIITAPDGTQIKRDIIFITYRDGYRGDNDLRVNGSVSIVGSVGRKKTSSAGGQIEAWLIILMIASIYSFRLDFASKASG